jgi:hypothetical protein
MRPLAKVRPLAGVLLYYVQAYIANMNFNARKGKIKPRASLKILLGISEC